MLNGSICNFSKWNFANVGRAIVARYGSIVIANNVNANFSGMVQTKLLYKTNGTSWTSNTQTNLCSPLRYNTKERKTRCNKEKAGIRTSCVQNAEYNQPLQLSTTLSSSIWAKAK